MTGAARLLGWFGTAAIAIAAVPVSAQPAPDPEAIFARARTIAEARVLPPYLEYTTYAAFIRKNHTDSEQLHVVVRTSDGASYVTPMADSPGDQRDAKSYVQKSPPYFWPATTFGLARSEKNDSQTFGRASGAPPPEPPIRPSSLHDYTVKYRGTEMLGNATVYHLILEPRDDPQTHQLREAYIDTTSFQTRRLVAAVYEKNGPFHVQPRAVVDYAPIEETWLVSSGTVDFTLRFGPFAFSGTGVLRLNDVRAPSEEPDWMFDASKLAAHQRG